MLTYRDEKYKKAEQVHRKILEDPNNGQIFMEAFENRAKEHAKKMPTLTALGYVLNQVCT